MIGRLSGILAEIGEEEAIVDCGGVGYIVRLGARSLSRLPPVGEAVLVHVESQWSEAQGLRLFGFLAKDERRAFVVLTDIPGVGPKAAMAVLDVLPPGELAGAVAREDKAAIGRANGVGPKLAARIVTELKGKTLGADLVIGTAAAPSVTPAAPSLTGEAVAGLMGLGVAEPVARRAVEQAALRLGENAGISALIKLALQEIGR
jgi:Holliday junction DNA helicase RuvA